jgi:hypothetical protein
LSRFSVDERFQWARTRQTTGKEDKVYSLLGIFIVSTPAVYGEGRDYAFDRLRDEIDRPSKGILRTPFKHNDCPIRPISNSRVKLTPLLEGVAVRARDGSTTLGVHSQLRKMPIP